MFKKTKFKIVCAVTLSLLALMTVTLATIYISNRISIRRESEEMLSTYAARYILGGENGQGQGENGQGGADGQGAPSPHLEEEPIPPELQGKGKFVGNEPQFKLSTFYSAAYSGSGEVLAVDCGDSGIKSEDEILSLCSEILKKNAKNGRTGEMFYLVDERADYTLVALLDGTITNNNQKNLFKQMLIIGSIATVILLIISVIISGRIVKPLEENDLRQKRFVSDAGHELKTPIAVTAANLELLKREIGENEWLKTVEYENGRMSDLVKQLLSLSRAERSDVVKEPTDFSSLAEREILAFESLAFECGKRLKFEISPELTVYGNANQLRQLVSIFIDNAVSHGVGDEITVSLKREKHYAAFTTKNLSKGLTEESLSRVFDRFYRADEARENTGFHYGLGLSIAKAITKAHGGKIVYKLQGDEITFTALIPIKNI